MPYYPAISLLVVYPVEMHSCIHQTIGTRVIIAALFITVKKKKLYITQLCISSRLDK